ELGQLEEQLKKLEKLKQERSVTFLLRGLSAQRYNQLYHEHPPRRDPGTGAVDVRDAYGYNSATFPAALVRASIVQPRMTDARWNKTINPITEGQFNKLFEAARQLTLRLRDQDAPFWLSSSENPLLYAANLGWPVSPAWAWNASPAASHPRPPRRGP